MEPTYTRHCRDCAKFEQSVSKEVGFCTNVPALRVKVCADADICESYKSAKPMDDASAGHIECCVPQSETDGRPPSGKCATCRHFMKADNKCAIRPSYKNFTCPDSRCDEYEQTESSKLADFLGCVDVSPDAEPESPFTYDTVHCDCVCKGCGALLYTDVVAVRTPDDDVKDVDMRFCPLCGYPAIKPVDIEEVKRSIRTKSPERRYAHGPVECIDAIKSALTPEEWRGFVKGNVLKYVWREAYKGGDCDLRKAADYLGRYFGKGGEVETVAEK